MAAAGIGAVAVASYALRRHARDVPAGRERVARSVTIRCDAESLYRRWRDPVQLPRFLHAVTDVETLGEDRMRWTMRATRRALHWEVRIVHDDPPRRLVWEATKGPFDAHATLTLVEAPHGRGTEVRLALGVRGPAVAVTARAARIFGISPPQFAMESLRRFKALAETGEIPVAVRA